MKTTYKQCALARKIPTGTEYQVAWIPSKYAIKDQTIKIRYDMALGAYGWEDGWVVLDVGDEIDSDDVPDHHKAVRMHRKNTGDSLRK